MFNDLREGVETAALGPLGAVLPQLMPMLLKKFNDVPEQKLRYTIAALCAKLAEVIEEDAPEDVIEPFQPLPPLDVIDDRPDVSRETSATLVPPPWANAELVADLGLQLLAEESTRTDDHDDVDHP